MVLVKSEFRRHGLATQLMRRAMEELAREGRIPILDATPDGRAVYRRLGFQDSWGFQRFIRREPRRPAAATSPPAGTRVRALASDDWPALCAYDAAAFGAERGAMLKGLRGRLPAAEIVAERDGRIAGFVLGRDGMLAGHLCPLIADDDAIACALLARALNVLDGPLFIDLADDKTAVRNFLEACGFDPVRPFTRMLYGTSARFDDSARTFAVVGPEFG
jgi:predicted GNAT family acetyltransferase